MRNEVSLSQNDDGGFGIPLSQTVRIGNIKFVEVLIGMASRCIHLAIANDIANKIDIKDLPLFYVGTVLPDAYSLGVNTANSHLKTKICDGTKITYRLTYFHETYGDKMRKDSLYLGYYMHLIQDLLYRQFVYDDYKWNPKLDGNVERLHNDYRLLNTYVIEKYNISSKLDISYDIKKEMLFDIYPFDLKQLINDFQEDFVPYKIGKAFFFTTDMADEYIERAAEKCIMEIKELQKGKRFIDEKDYAWKAHV